MAFGYPSHYVYQVALRPGLHVASSGPTQRHHDLGPGGPALHFALGTGDSGGAVTQKVGVPTASGLGPRP